MGKKRKPRRSREHAELAAMASFLDGREIAGACPDCNAVLSEGCEPGGTYWDPPAAGRR